MPRISEHRKEEIVAIFQASFKRDNSKELKDLTLAELRDADEMLGERDINSGFRIALRNRIRVLESQDQRRYESRIRAWNLAIGVVTGVLITLLAARLTRWL